MNLDYILLVVIALGVFAGAYSFGRHPTAWLEVITAAVKQFGPAVVGYLLKAEDPETRKKRQAVERSGGVWDPIRKRERER